MDNFTYLRPTGLAEAIEALRAHAAEAKLMAGGQSLLVLMREGLTRPGVVVSLRGVPGLAGIRLDAAAGRVEIGGLASHRAVEGSALIRERFPLLHEAYRLLANPQVRTLGTLAGNLCHNAPGSDPPAPLAALDATVTLVGPDGERELSAEAFGTDFFETALGEAEVLTRVRVPLLAPRTGTAYRKFNVRPTDMAIVGVAARVTLDADGRCEDARIALTGVAPTVIRARGAEAALRGQALSDRRLADAAEAATGEIDPISDLHATAAYRRRLVPVAVRRVVGQAWARARGGP